MTGDRLNGSTVQISSEVIGGRCGAPDRCLIHYSRAIRAGSRGRIRLMRDDRVPVPLFLHVSVLQFKARAQLELRSSCCVIS